MSPVTGIKRKRRGPEPVLADKPTVKHLALREIELEIAMKKRIAETVEARITCALYLKHLLENNPTVNDTHIDRNGFQDAALRALDAIERPCQLILTREPLFASTREPSLDNCAEATGFPPNLDPDLVGSLGPSQHLSRVSSSHHRIIRNPNSNVKLLFIRNASIPLEFHGTPPLTGPNVEIARIECSDCGRWDFSNLQGFLNHCRIRHQREYGSHDECIQECSTLVAYSERDWVLENGTEITGVGIPSLRRLFEIAVGRKTSLFPLPSSEQDASTIERKEETVSEGPETEGTHLSRTLGVHQETPALAAVLGRCVSRRQIRAYNEDEFVDIENGGDHTRSERRWKMKFCQRNLARPELEVNSSLTHDPSSKSSPSVGDGGDGSDNRWEVTLEAEKLASTRFHMICRIVIADRSRWLLPETRPSSRPDDTHGWIIAIQSPSYGLDVTRVLSRVTVTGGSENSQKSLAEPLMVSEPPFVIESTTDAPFLAKVTLDWNGRENAQTMIEHWVQIDRLRTGYATLGQEQLLDVELCRNTPLAPQRDNSITWRTSTRPTTETSTPASIGPVIDENTTPDSHSCPV